MYIRDSNFDIEFHRAKIVNVFNDELMILELSNKWSFAGVDIKYFIVRNRSAGYLSDLVVQGKISVDVDYLENTSSPNEMNVDKYKLRWLGRIEWDNKNR